MRTSIAICFMLAMVSAGCAASSSREDPMTDLRVGDQSSYSAVESGTTIDVSVRGLENVLDADGMQVSAFLIDYWYNQTQPNQLQTHFVEATDPSSGGLFWIAAICSLGNDAGECDRDIVTLSVRGLPGFFGRSFASSESIDPRSKCKSLSAESHPARNHLLPYGIPPGNPLGGSVTFCAGSLPEAFTTMSGEVFTQTKSFEGGGAAVRILADPPTMPSKARSFPTAWNGRYPPEPDWPQNLTYAEAWSFLNRESPEFRDFLMMYPGTYLHSTSLAGWGGFTADLPIAGDLLNQTSTERQLILQSPSGEALEFTIEKRVSRETTYSITSSRKLSGEPTLHPADVQAAMMTPREATDEVLQRLDGSWQETQVLTSVPGPTGRINADTHYIYQVLVAPPDAQHATADVNQYYPYSVMLRADTGEWLHATAQHGFIGLAG